MIIMSSCNFSPDEKKKILTICFFQVKKINDKAGIFYAEKLNYHQKIKTRFKVTIIAGNTGLSKCV